jgi:tRNA guanosine-2'-O-methyltransferase
MTSLKDEFSKFRIQRVLKNWKSFNLNINQKEYLTMLLVNEKEEEVKKEIQNVNYQRKITPYSMKDLESDLNPRLRYSGRDRQSLIIVASFIDKLPNLAGLTRTSEIFSIEKLIVNSKKNLDDPEFLNISVSAEKWLTIEEVKIENLQEFFVEQKKIGYSIVGVEQTQDSVSLEHFNFPEKFEL